MFPPAQPGIFADGNVPTVFLHNGEHVTFRFNYDDSAQGFTYTFSGLGAALTAEVSPDGSTWTALPGESGQLQDTAAPGEGNVFYLRFTANVGDAFLKTPADYPPSTRLYRWAAPGTLRCLICRTPRPTAGILLKISWIPIPAVTMRSLTTKPCCWGRGRIC